MLEIRAGVLRMPASSTAGPDLERAAAVRSSRVVELAWNNDGGFGAFRGQVGSLNLSPEMTKPLALQGVSVERVTGSVVRLTAYSSRFPAPSLIA